MLLLVLDNLEQVVDVGVGVAELLAHCPGLVVLATSRIPLRVRAERQMAVPPLDDQAVDLFVDRAVAVDAAFRLTPERRAVVAEICRRLDGLPLAIELAAARVDLLSPAALLARLTDRLTPLGTAPRDLPDRQRTLRDAIAWSEDLLAPAERETFRRLAIFSGRFTGDEAGALATGADAAITTLVEHSLLRRHLDGDDDQTTFSMLQTIRAFGRERLDAGPDADLVRLAHAALVAGVAREADAGLVGPDQRRWLRRLDRLQDDCQAVLTTALVASGGDAALGLRLATDLWRYWETRGRLLEGKAWLERAVAAAGDRPTPELARALNDLGNLELDLGGLAPAGAHYRRSLALREAAGDQTGIADTLNNLGLVALAENRLAAAVDLHTRSLAIRRRLGDRSGEALSLTNLGDVALARDEPEPAIALQAESLAIFEGLGNDRRVAYALANLAEARLATRHPGDIAVAADLLARAGALFDQLAEPTGQALVRLHLATIARHAGDSGNAVRLIREALLLRRDQGQAPGVVECLERLGGLGGDARLLSAADAIRAARGWPRTPSGDAAWVTALRAVRTATPPAAFAGAWEAGRSLDLDEAVDLALADAAPLAVTARCAPVLPDGLSAREVEVLRLVAAGLTNAEIGDRLFLSRTTINAHLRRIYPKIGVDNRASASTYAVGAGLVEAEQPALSRGGRDVG